MSQEKLDLGQLSRKVIDTGSTVVIYMTLTALICGQNGEGLSVSEFLFFQLNIFFLRSSFIVRRLTSCRISYRPRALSHHIRAKTNF